jgi:hypothetical protein
MPCGICKETGHNANTCTSPIIETQARKIALELNDRLDHRLRNSSNLSPGTLYQETKYNTDLSSTQISIKHTLARNRGTENIRDCIIAKRTKWISDWMIGDLTIYRITKGAYMSVSVLSKAIPLALTYINDHITSISPSFSSIIADFKRLHINVHRTKLKSHYRHTIKRCFNYVFRAIIPDSFLNITDFTIDQLCEPQPPPVVSNDQAIKIIITNLITNNDNVENCINTIYQIRKSEVDRALRKERAHQLRRIQQAETQAVKRITNKQKNIKFKMDTSITMYAAEDTCPVCMEELSNTNTVAMSCSHAFCAGCTGNFINKCNGQCPYCREKITEVRFKHDLLPEHFNTLVSTISL